MKTISIIFTTILLTFALNVTAAPTPQQNTATIQINGKQVVIPLKHQNHWIRITEKSDGKTSHIVVQSRDGKHGKVITKRFKINNKRPATNAYNVVERSGSYQPNRKQTKEMLRYLQEQQAFMHRFFVQRQREMQAQLTLISRDLAALQHQLTQVQIPPPSAPRKKVH